MAHTLEELINEPVRLRRLAEEVLPFAHRRKGKFAENVRALATQVLSHLVRPATIIEAKEDCCGDRYACNVAYICSCGLRGCEGCMKNHIFVIHEA